MMKSFSQELKYMNEGMQQALLLAQIQKKRALKEQYLYASQSRNQPEPAKEENALTGTVMANLMVFAIKGRKDIFGLMDDLRRNPSGQNLMDSVLSWIETLSEALDVSAYELFIDDVPRRRKIVYGLLNQLRQDAPDNWEDIRMDESGNASLSLPDFDVYWRMTSASPHEISLVLQREHSGSGVCYRLMVGSTARTRPDQLLPDYALLWEEHGGALADFVEQTLSDLQGGWLLLRKGFRDRRERLEQELQKLADLAAVLEEQPEGLNPAPVLEKEARILEQLREEARRDYGRMPAALKDGPRGQTARNGILLLGGAVRSLRRAGEDPEIVQTALSETIYLLEGALQADGA